MVTHKPMTYADLFAAVGRRFAGSYRVEVGTWRYAHDSEPSTTWAVTVLIERPEKRCIISTGATPEEALFHFERDLAALPAGPDQTGVDALVGRAEVKKP